MRNFRCVIFFALFVFLLSITTHISAESKEPFSSLQFGLTNHWNVNSNDFHRFWNQRYGYAFTVGTPFYLGTFSIDGRVLAFSGESRTDPGFTNIYLAMAWAVEIPLPMNFRWSAGLSAGNDFFAFESGNIYSKYESELGIELNTELSLPVTKSIRVAVQSVYHKIYTYKPIYLGYLGIGLRYEVPTPGWLREFLW